MRQVIKEKLNIILSFLVFYLIIEIIMFKWVDFGFLPKHLLIDLMIAFALASFIFLIKSTKISIIYIAFIFGLIITLFLINATMYSVYYDLFTLQQLQLINEARHVFSFDHISFSSIIIATIVSLFYLAYLIYLWKKYTKTDILISRFLLKGLAYFATSMIIVFSFFYINTESINDFVEDTNVTALKRSRFEKYGFFGYYTKEVEDLLHQANIIQDNYVNVDPNLSEPTDYFGLLEGYNVINILLESVQSFAINEVLTPNLYMLMQEGLYFPNSYSENKTNVSELISIIGNYPTVHISTNYNEYDFSYALPNILNSSNGYITNFFHDNVPEFYSRGTLMPQIGFENNYFHDDLFPDLEMWHWTGDYTLDSVTMDRMLPYLSSTTSPFYSFWATMSTHGPYNQGTINIPLFEQYGYFDAIDQAKEQGLWINVLDGYSEEDELRIRHYQAEVMNLDEAIGLMLDDLETKNILDNTIIILYGDHNVYYHNIHMKMFEDTDNSFYNMDMYKNFFCIYNQTLSQEYLRISGDTDTVIDECVSPYVIAPTLLDLMGYQYDENLFLGTSVFDDVEDVFYSFKLTGFMNCNLYSSDGETILYYKTYYTDEELAIFSARSELIKFKIDYINDWYLSSQNNLN